MNLRFRSHMPEVHRVCNEHGQLLYLISDDQPGISGSKLMMNVTEYGTVTATVTHTHMESVVCGHAQVSGQTIIYTGVTVAGDARVSGSVVLGDSSITSALWIDDLVTITGSAVVMGRVYMAGSVMVSDNAIIDGMSNIMLKGKRTRINGFARVSGKEIHIDENAHITDAARIGSHVSILGDAVVGGDAFLTNITVGGDAQILGGPWHGATEFEKSLGGIIMEGRWVAPGVRGP